MAAAGVTRSRLASGLLAGLLLLTLLPGTAVGASPKGDRVRAVLDGKALALAEVGNYFCHDFAYPEIQCFTDADSLETSTAASEPASLDQGGAVDVRAAATSGVTYVTIYDWSYYGGSYMHLSQDYWSLSTIGWNDRISSFIVRNSQSGAFYTDWMNGGTRYNFCCNSAVAALGSYDNTFSSVNQN